VTIYNVFDPVQDCVRSNALVVLYHFWQNDVAKRRLMNQANLFTFLLVSLASNAYSDRVRGDTFGSGTSAFDIALVTIGNPGSTADISGNPNPAGSVANTYRIAKFETSEQMIDKANVLGGLDITKNTRGPDKPATQVSWNEAARFVNWLNTSTGSAPAYKFAVQPGESGYYSNADIQVWTPGDKGYNPNNLYRNSRARYFLPSIDEWYKAAYYDPTSGSYYDYPTASDNAPTAVASGTAPGTAVYEGQSGPADITFAGGLSPYGTMAQAGNIYEWGETDFDLANGTGSSAREVRGGSWKNVSNNLLSSKSFNVSPTAENNLLGFRVAGIAVLVGDFNSNGVVDAADYTVWRDHFGTSFNLAGNGDESGTSFGIVDQADYNLWKTHLGQSLAGATASAAAAVPEPSTMVMVLILAAFLARPTYRRRSA
jgi:Sulfatase-modifying factor enzyme 1